MATKKATYVRVSRKLRQWIRERLDTSGDDRFFISSANRNGSPSLKNFRNSIDWKYPRDSEYCSHFATKKEAVAAARMKADSQYNFGKWSYVVTDLKTFKVVAHVKFNAARAPENS